MDSYATYDLYATCRQKQTRETLQRWKLVIDEIGAQHDLNFPGQ
jgi:hypothetical protein